MITPLFAPSVFRHPYVGIIQIRLWVEGVSFLSACLSKLPSVCSIVVSLYRLHF